MSYVAIYRARVRPPPQPILVAKGRDYAVHLHPGPLFIQCQALAANPLSPANVFDFEYDTRRFPAGSYVVVQVPPQPNPALAGAGWNAAFDRFAQVVAVLELEFPGIVRERLYEGTASTPATPMFIDLEEGLQLGDRTSYAHDDVATVLQTRTDHVGQLSGKDAERFTLASRWFRRANDAKNSIDRVLFYYMVLEVYPTTEGTDVPGAVSRLLSERLYPSLSAQEVKVLLNLGRICGFRGEIIHEGKASVATPDELQTVNDHGDRLRAIARTCLRILIGLSPGTELDLFVRPQDG